MNLTEIFEQVAQKQYREFLHNGNTCEPYEFHLIADEMQFTDNEQIAEVFDAYEDHWYALYGNDYDNQFMADMIKAYNGFKREMGAVLEDVAYDFYDRKQYDRSPVAYYGQTNQNLYGVN